MSAGTTLLVAGGGGLIGSNLVDPLVADGCPVRVLDNLTATAGDLAVEEIT